MKNMFALLLIAATMFAVGSCSNAEASSARKETVEKQAPKKTITNVYSIKAEYEDVRDVKEDSTGVTFTVPKRGGCFCGTPEQTIRLSGSYTIEKVTK